MRRTISGFRVYHGAKVKRGDIKKLDRLLVRRLKKKEWTIYELDITIRGASQYTILRRLVIMMIREKVCARLTKSKGHKQVLVFGLRGKE